jgi:hypothetical protein
MPRNKVAHCKDGWQYVNITVHKNQKVIKILKLNTKGLIYDLTANRTAMSTLSPAAFMLYSHFIQNITDYTEVLSRKTLLETTTLSSRTYDSAVKELIANGYLVKTTHPDYEDYYLFYEDPRRQRTHA